MMEFDMLPEGPLYLEVGNGIKHVMQRLSKKSHTRAYEMSSSIDCVVLRGRYSRFIDTHVSYEELYGVFTMTSCLTHLKRFSIRRLQIPIPVLANLLRHDQLRKGGGGGGEGRSNDDNHSKTEGGGGGLEEIELRSICLAGSRREMEEFAQALQSHTSLTKISLSDCRPEGGSCRVLDPVFIALASMTALQDLEIHLMELPRWLGSVDYFEQLFRGHLRSLTLSYLRIPESFIIGMTESLKNNHSMEYLYLDRCDSLTPQSAYCMAQMLRENTRLKRLKLVVKRYEDCIPIAEALETENSTLTSLFLRSYHQDEVSPYVYDAFLSMVQKNYSLRELFAFVGDPVTPLMYPDPILTFYLKLNKAGRGKLLAKEETTATNEQWVEVIIASKDDIQCTYYFLSQNPSVCQGAMK